jgi:REP element-mobilizing transposase RayT
MPRQARIDAPGAIQHVIIRGIERRRIFHDDKDRDAFVERLGRILLDSVTTCYGWALMPNHAHFLLRTGRVPIATIMRRLLTWHAGTFNRRHRRHGHLFQNRYKSILCQEEPYLLELVRYIHLNPLRGRQVRDLGELDLYPYAGHSALMGKQQNDWQETGFVLGQFGRRVGVARRAYRNFIEAGIPLGRRPELVGGGLIRSLGGWKAVQALGKGSARLKGDERILGDSEFVLDVLEASEEQLRRQDRLQRQGYDMEGLARQVARMFGIRPDDIYRAGKRPLLVSARSVFCYWAVRELGLTTTAVARVLGLTQPAVSIAVRRGERIATLRGIQLDDA